jgi:Phage capsid protein
MSINLPSHAVSQFSTNISLLLQQRGSKLRNAVMTGSHVGKQASPVDQYGAVEAQQVLSKFSDMVRVDAPVDRRWVFPSDWELPQLIDSFDKLRMITDPTSALVQAAVYGMGRRIDSIIIDAFFDDAKTGETGATTTPFATATQTVGVSTGGTTSNLNVAKLRAAKKILMANEVDLDNDPIYCIITADEHDALLNEIQVISTDFNSKPVLVEGRVQQFLGINFIHCERLELGTDDVAGTSTALPFFAKSGMYFGLWADIMTDVSQIKTKTGMPWQVYAKMTLGATRLEEKKVVRIWAR